MASRFQLREDYATCEYPAWFLALCKEYEIDFNYVKIKWNVWSEVYFSYFCENIYIYQERPHRPHQWLLIVVCVVRGCCPKEIPISHNLKSAFLMFCNHISLVSRDDFLLPACPLVWWMWWEAVVRKWFRRHFYYSRPTHKPLHCFLAADNWPP